MTIEQQACQKRDAHNGVLSQFATTDKLYVCKQCDRSFHRVHYLKSHLATHSKTFQCTTCHHFFKRQHDLKRHQKLHTGERPFACQDCGRSFARLDALNRHQRAGHHAAKKAGTSPSEHLLVSLPPLKNHDPGRIAASSPNRITLPPPDQLLLQEKVSCLAQENQCLKLEMKQLTMDNARMHELEKENMLLKSLIRQHAI